MSVLALIGLLVSVAGGLKDLADIAKELHDMGFQPGDIIPEEHLKRIHVAITNIPSQDDALWDDLHANNGG